MRYQKRATDGRPYNKKCVYKSINGTFVFFCHVELVETSRGSVAWIWCYLTIAEENIKNRNALSRGIRKVRGELENNGRKIAYNRERQKKSQQYIKINGEFFRIGNNSFKKEPVHRKAYVNINKDGQRRRQIGVVIKSRLEISR